MVDEKRSPPRPVALCAAVVAVAACGVIVGPARAGQARGRLLAMVSRSGVVRLSLGKRRVATITPGLYEKQWRGASMGASTQGEPAKPGGVLRGTIRAPGGGIVDCELRARPEDAGVRFAYVLTPRSRMDLNSLHVSMAFPIAVVAGGAYVADGERGTIPKEFGSVHIRAGETRSLAFDFPGGGGLALRYESVTPVLLQDNRRWGPTFSVRMGPQSGEAESWPAGRRMGLAFLLTAEGGVDLEYDLPVTIEAGAEWLPLAVELDIVPGSALDFSGFGQFDAPAGKHGRLLARQDGQFAFEKDPETPRRFYGVNLCFSAHYITHEQSDRLAERIMRLGYNTVRFHHYEGELVSGGSGASSIRVDEPPTSTRELTSFEAPADLGERYGARVRGYLHPPATGEYVLFVASDDGSDLYLSTDDDPAKKTKIASVRGWTARRQWDKYPSQRSKPVRLESGRRYYIEALHREGVLGDHLEVAWRGPGVDGIIPGECLSPFTGGARGKIVHELWKDPVMVDSAKPNPRKLDQLDYLFAALKKRGVYVTTDLFVSRPVMAGEIWAGEEGLVGMDEFKMLVPVNDRAFANWKRFAKNLLTHVDPYTGTSYAKDPALAWLSMINEGNFGNKFGDLKGKLERDWQAAWNRWLAGRYGSRKALVAAWGRDPGGDPGKGSVPFHKDVYDDSPRGRDLAVFCAETERDMFRRMKRFLREEVGTRALLTNMNGWTNRLPYQAARTEYDFVDDHFYVDHPQFIEKPWQLPSRCPNTSPVAGGATGGRHCGFRRLLDRPFTITEYNYSGPGRFRGVG
ncbi:MAG: PA14 domain-containing protein, partial [Planctomycetota bacterium]